MSSRPHTTDRWTNLGEEYKKQLKALKNRPYVKNGILGEKASEIKNSVAAGAGIKKMLRGGSPPTIVEVAIYNEFGTSDGRVPERSFIRSTWDANANNKATWAGYAEELKTQINAGKMTVQKALAKMGARIKADVQEKIRSMIPPPNAPSTLAAKYPKTKTLINTGQLLNAQDWEVQDRHEL